MIYRVLSQAEKGSRIKHVQYCYVYVYFLIFLTIVTASIT